MKLAKKVSGKETVKENESVKGDHHGSDEDSNKDDEERWMNMEREADFYHVRNIDPRKIYGK